MRWKILILVALWTATPLDAQPTDAGTPKLTVKYPSKFEFGGGQLIDLVKAIRAEFGVDLSSIGTIPDRMLIEVWVPKMRLGGEGQRLDFRNILHLYNSVAEKGDPALGRWIIEGPMDREPNVIMLVSGVPKQSSFAVKAFALTADSPQKRHTLREMLQRIVETEKDRIMVSYHRNHAFSPEDLRGQFQYHDEAGIVVATGGRIYVELVSEIVQAMNQKARMGDLILRTNEKPDTIK